MFNLFFKFKYDFGNEVNEFIKTDLVKFKTVQK